MAVEYELKYRATPDILAAIDASLPETPQVYHMETTYYDTPDRDLAQRCITLRRRLENHLSVCTLKAPADQGRLEFELEKDRIQDALPELCKLSGIPELPALLEKGIEPVCSAKFTRIARTIRCLDTTLEIALDQGVLLGGRRQQPLCEVEVELKSGAPQVATAYAGRLALAYGLTPETMSKFKRAYLLSQEV